MCEITNVNEPGYGVECLERRKASSRRPDINDVIKRRVTSSPCKVTSLQIHQQCLAAQPLTPCSSGPCEHISYRKSQILLLQQSSLTSSIYNDGYTADVIEADFYRISWTLLTCYQNQSKRSVCFIKFLGRYFEVPQKNLRKSLCRRHFETDYWFIINNLFYLLPS